MNEYGRSKKKRKEKGRKKGKEREKEEKGKRRVLMKALMEALAVILMGALREVLTELLMGTQRKALLRESGSMPSAPFEEALAGRGDHTPFKSAGMSDLAEGGGVRDQKLGQRRRQGYGIRDRRRQRG